MNADFNRIVAATHDAPHRVLGPHEAPNEPGVWILRAFQPDTHEVRVFPAGDPIGTLMTRVHDGGVFEARIRSERRPAYELEIDAWGQRARARDPYAFDGLFAELDVHLFAEGTHESVYRLLGAHVRDIDGVVGTAFSVWAPNAKRVSVVGDFQDWDERLLPMTRNEQGVWQLFLPGIAEGALYKFAVLGADGVAVMKADPYARRAQVRPETASIVDASHHAWTDDAWIAKRRATDWQRKPVSIYEVHLGSWRRPDRPADASGDPARPTYRELAHELVDYVADLGFTHIELLPVLEHPYDGSWGYQVTGYFAPTARYGSPDDFRYFVDRCHARGVGVILDWVPAHFPRDAWALARFDGGPLYEHPDPRQGSHAQWGTLVFDYERFEVKNFLLASALYWLDEFHVDGLRFDAVASMLYLDYGKDDPNEWVPNKFGGRENLGAVAFLRDVCERAHALFPGVLLCAEESTTWPGVTRSTYLGGLGFDLKWNMGWMHDTLDYFKLDPIHRAFHHHLITFSLMYAFSERFLLPLSHDEVVHLKRSLLSKMPGPHETMLAHGRSMFAFMWTHPGKKLLFMGGEIGQLTEWNHEGELEWRLLEHAGHKGLLRLVRDLNELYRRERALHEIDDDFAGFQWIDANDAMQSVASYIRFPRSPEGGRATTGKHVVFVGNFTPVQRVGYRVGVPRRSAYREVLNSDAKEYAGKGGGNFGKVAWEPVAAHAFPQSIVLTLPPLTAILLMPEDEDSQDTLKPTPAPPPSDPRRASPESLRTPPEPRRSRRGAKPPEE